MIGFNTNPLHFRKTSGFSLSLATGLAMETLFRPRQEVFDPDRVVPKSPKRNYNVLAVSVQTLIRNIVNACDNEHWVGLNPTQVLEVLIQEIEVLRSLCLNEGMGKIQAVFFESDYDTVMVGLSPLFRLREDTTPTLRMMRSLMENTVSDLKKAQEQVFQIRDVERMCQSSEVLMLTHRPMDLLIYPNVKWLSLLESHTGKVKDYRDWNTKYHRFVDARFDRLPFLRVLLYLFGDSSTIAPTSLKIRRKILEEAERDRWNPGTSNFRVMTCLERLFEGEGAIVKDLRYINNIRHY